MLIFHSMKIKLSHSTIITYGFKLLRSPYTMQYINYFILLIILCYLCFTLNTLSAVMYICSSQNVQLVKIRKKNKKEPVKAGKYEEKDDIAMKKQSSSHSCIKALIRNIDSKCECCFLFLSHVSKVSSRFEFFSPGSFT